MRHIRTPVTLPPEQAEKLYIAAQAVQELAELIEGDEQVPENLLRVLGEHLADGIGETSFPFED